MLIVRFSKSARSYCSSYIKKNAHARSTFSKLRMLIVLKQNKLRVRKGGSTYFSLMSCSILVQAMRSPVSSLKATEP